MTTQMIVSEAERTAIEEEIRSIINKAVETCQNFDISYWESLCDNTYNLGAILGVDFFPSMTSIIQPFKELFPTMERMQLVEIIEMRVGVLTPEIVIVSDLTRWSDLYKDGRLDNYNQSDTFVFVKIEGEWKIVHYNVLMQPLEE